MKRHFYTILMLVSAAALVYGIVQLFALRFRAGDVYPNYSSLRSDPLGTMAFYESLQDLPGFSVARDFSTANRLPGETKTTYFHIATSREAWRTLPAAMFDEIERFVTGGGRLVITLFPEAIQEPWLRDLEEDEKKSEPAPGNKDPGPRGTRPISIKERWGVEFQVVKLERTAESAYAPAPVRNESGLPLPETLDWHSGVVFTKLDPAWKAIYMRGSNAVLIERAFGNGAVAIATDSYFLSNEAMWKERHADLLAWLVGSNRNVMFDEAHLGVTEKAGMAALMRKYRLHWFVAGLFLLSGLFIWKNAASLVPLPQDAKARDYVAGRDASAGFVNLLRRSIPPRDLLDACFAEWKKSGGPIGRYSATRIQEAEGVFLRERARGVKDRNPVETYKAISGILKNKIK